MSLKRSSYDYSFNEYISFFTVQLERRRLLNDLKMGKNKQSVCWWQVSSWPIVVEFCVYFKTINNV